MTCNARFHTRTLIPAMTFASLCMIAGCSSTQVGRVDSNLSKAEVGVQQAAVKISPALMSGCNDTIEIVNIAGLVPGVGAIAPYANLACLTAEGLTKLAADPSSLSWLQDLQHKVEDLTPKRRLPNQNGLSE